MQSVHHGFKQFLANVLSSGLIFSMAPPPSRAATERAHGTSILWHLPQLSRSRQAKLPGVNSASFSITPAPGNSLASRGGGTQQLEGNTVVPAIAADSAKSRTHYIKAESIVKPSVVGNTKIPGARPLAFLENKGQFNDRVKFQVPGGGRTLWLTASGIVFDFAKAKSTQTSAQVLESQPGKVDPNTLSVRGNPRIEKPAIQETERQVIYQDFVGTNRNVTIESKGVQQGAYNYLSGSDPSKWQTKIRAFSEVVYHNVWNGVDLRLYGNAQDLEQEFIVKPKADLNLVHVAYEGIDTLEIAKDGALVIRTAKGQMRETAPRIYQEIAGRRIPVLGRFKLLSSTSYTFEVATYRDDYPLVIDPTLLYSTYLGGSASNSPYTGNNQVATGIAVDTSGSAYVTGYTAATDFPTTPGAFQTSTGPGQEVFVSKLNPTGSGLIYSTYLSASWAASIAVDPAGNAYIAGWGVGTGFPTTPNAYSQYCSDSGFLTVLNASGSGLLYSTCFGSFIPNVGGSPVVRSVTVDAGGHAYVAGDGGVVPTTPNAFQTSNPGSRGDIAFAMVFDTNASSAASLTYSTYFGIPSSNSGAYGTGANAIAADLYGNMYITGYAGDSLPVTPGAFQNSLATGIMCNPSGGTQWVCPNGFVAKFNPSASGAQSLIYSTYLGGPGNDAPLAIAVDNSGNAYVTGYTFSNNFPVTQGAFQTTAPGVAGNTNVAFVTKLNAGGSGLAYSTYLGPVCAAQPCIQESVSANAIALDGFGNAYVAGNFRAFLITFPTTPDAFQNNYNSKLSGDFSEAFLTKLNSTGSGLVYSSYLGGEGDDVATAVAVDQTGDAYVVGHTSSLTFPVTSFAFQPSIHGTGDAFVTKFPLGTNQSLSVTSITPTSGGNAGTVSPQIFGTGFHAGATAQLKCGSGIVSTNLAVGPGGRFLNTTFNLTTALPGMCDVVVTNPDGTSATLPQAFTIQQGGAPNIQLYVTGVEARKVPGEVAQGPASSLVVTTVSNTGSVDLPGGSISLAMGSPFTLTSANPAGLASVSQGSSGDFEVWPSVPVPAGSSQTATATSATPVAPLCGSPPLGVQACFTPDECTVNTAQFNACIGADLTLEGGCGVVLETCTEGLGEASVFTFLGCVAAGVACSYLDHLAIERCLDAPGVEVCHQGTPICFTD
jgi:hypothetical protein